MSRKNALFGFMYIVERYTKLLYTSLKYTSLEISLHIFFNEKHLLTYTADSYFNQGLTTLANAPLGKPNPPSGVAVFRAPFLWLFPREKDLTAPASRALN